jgi:tape measure domain-containing protein
MPEPTILEYRGITADLEAKLLSLKKSIESLNSQTDVPHELKINVEDALNRLSLLNTRVNVVEQSTRTLSNVKFSQGFKNEIDQEIAQINRAQSSINSSFRNIAANAIASNAQVGSSAKNAANQVTSNYASIYSSTTRVISGLTSLQSIVRLVVFSRIIRELKDFGTQSVETSVELQALHNSFVAIIGDANEADSTLDRLRNTADTFGKKFLDVTENYLRFRIASESAGLSTKANDAIFNSLIITSTALNQSTSQLNRTFTAFEQILSKGVLSAEEVRRQLGNALPGAFSIVARAVGVSNAELEKLLRSGSLLSAEVAPKIAQELLKTFGPAAIANVGSARAEFGRFSNDVLDLKKAIGDGLLPVVVEVTRELSSLVENTNLSEVTEDIGDIAQKTKIVVDLLISLATINPSKLIGATLEAGAAQVDSVQKVLTDTIANITGLFSESAAQGVQKYYQEHKSRIGELVEGIKIWIGATKEGGDVAVEYNTKAAKAVEEIQKQLQILQDKGGANLEGFNQDLDKSRGKIGQLAKSLNEVEDGLTEIENKAAKTWTKDFNSMVQYATRLEQIKLDAKEAGVFSGELATQIGALEARFGPAAVSAGLLNAQLKELGVKSADSINVAIESLNGYIGTFKDGSSVTQEQADLIVKSIKDILESIRELPPGQREAFKDLENSLESVQNKYTKFTTEAAKEAEKLRKETSKAFKGLADELKDIFEDLKQSISGQDENVDNIKELKREFDELQKRFNEGGLPLEDLNRYNELTGIIAEKQRNAGDAIREVFDSTSREVSKSIEDLILKNDKLIEGVARLSPTAQQAFISLVQNFSDLSKTTEISTLDLEDFGTRLGQIFEQSGVKLDGFIASLSQTATLSEKIKAQIADAQAQIESKHTDSEGNKKQQSQEIDISPTVNSVDRIKESVNSLSDIWVVEGNHWKELNVQSDDASKSIDQLRQEYDELRNSIGNGTLGLGELQTAVKRQGEILAEVNSRQDEYVVGSEEFNQSQKDVRESVEGSGSALVDLANATEQARKGMEPITDQSRILKNTTDALSDSIQISSDKNEEMAAAFDRNKDAIAGLKERQDDYILSVNTTGTTYDEATGKAKEFGDQVTDTADVLKNTAPTMEDSLKGVGTEAGKVETILGRVKALIIDCQKETKTWKEIIDGTNEGLETPTEV